MNAIDQYRNTPQPLVVPTGGIFGAGNCFSLRRHLRHNSIPLHAHEFDECAVVEAGAGWHLTETGCRLIGAGDIIWVARGRAHAYLNGAGLTVSNIYFVPGWLSHHCGIDDAGDRSGTASLADGLVALNQLETGRANPEEVSRSVRNLVLGGPYGGAGEKDRSDLRLQRVRAICRYLERNIVEPINAEDLARRFHLSRRALFRLFAETVGVAPREYRLRCQLSRALELLSVGDHSVGETSAASGFEDSNYFSKIFSDRLGMTPRQACQELFANHKRLGLESV